MDCGKHKNNNVWRKNGIRATITETTTIYIHVLQQDGIVRVIKTSKFIVT